MRALVLALLLFACGSSSSDAHSPTALKFTKHLVARDFVAAHTMLAMPMSRDELQTKFDEMTTPIGKLGESQVMQTMTDWPDKQRGDLGWAYVAIAGEHGGEGITLVVTREHKIRSIEWGRP